MKSSFSIPLRAALVGALFPVAVWGGLVAEYAFEDSLESSVAGPPALHYLGTGPVFMDELFPSGNQRVLRFPAGDGLELAGFSDLVGESYTLVAVFRFDETTSWRRIFDFKNATSDWGLYGYYSRLNFYNIQTGPDDVVKQAEYIEVVLSRDDAGHVRGYVDGSLQIDFADASRRQALPNADNLLVLFRDDRVVPNEHTSGRITRLRIYDRALSDEEIRDGVAELDVRFGGGSEALTEGWRRSQWFGLYNEAHYPWLHSPEMGWTHVSLLQNGSFWLYMPGFGYVWSDETAFPFGYDPVGEDWVVSGSEGGQHGWWAFRN